jgi:hypothetical protein
LEAAPQAIGAMTQGIMFTVGCITAYFYKEILLLLLALDRKLYPINRATDRYCVFVSVGYRAGRVTYYALTSHRFYLSAKLTWAAFKEGFCRPFLLAMSIKKFIWISLMAIMITIFCWPLYFTLMYELTYAWIFDKKPSEALMGSGKVKLETTVNICFMIAMLGYIAVLLIWFT